MTPRTDDEPGTTRRGFIALSAGAVAAAALRGAAPAGAQPIRAVPTPTAAFGFPLGQRAASNTQIAGYLKALAAASPRVRAAALDRATVRGQDIPYAIVSHPDNLDRLDTIAATLRSLKRTPTTDARAAAAVRDLPAIVHLYANVHGNEPSGADALVQLLYGLASRDDAANDRRLRELVLFVMPVQNPDGRDASRRVNLAAFDLNRDWFAMTQPETPGKVALWSRYPGILGLDVHEQFLSAPDTFYFPPANDPVHHETPRVPLAQCNERYTPAIEQAFTGKGYAYEHYHAYDLFYPGYGDVMPAHAWGAAGVLFEMENSNAYDQKVARQSTAVEAVVTVAAEQRRALLTAWAQQWRAQEAAGRRGRLGANLRQNPASPAPIPAPAEKVYGYAIRTARSAADVSRLVDRLRAFDIEVHVLTRAVKVARLRPFGGRAFGRATLARGTVLVRTDQPMKAFVNILLADDPHAAVNYFYDSAGWSNPALMALDGGAIGEPLGPLLKRPPRAGRRGPAPVATARAVKRAADLTRAPRAGAAAYAFALDSAMAQAAAFALAQDGVAVARAAGAVGGLADGAAVVPGSARSAVEAARKRFGVRPVTLGAAPADAVPVRRPRVALYSSPGTDATELLFASSRGFARWLLAKRFGLETIDVVGPDLELGALGTKGIDVLVVPDGLATVVPGGQSVPNVVATPPGAGLTPVGLQNVQTFVSRGGTYLGWRTQGVVLAQGAGIAGDLVTVGAPRDLVIPGLPITIDLAGSTAATRGLPTRAYAYNVTDPILTGGGTTIAAYPKGDDLRALGYTAGLAALAGTVAGTRVAVGKGESYVFAFDPAYRGYVEGTQRLVGNVLLGAAGPAAAMRADAGPSAALPVDLRRVLRGAVVPVRWTVLRVGAADASALRAARDAIGPRLPAGVDLAPAADGSGGLELRAIDRDPLSGHPAAWVSEVLTGLARRGVRAEFVLA